MLSASIAYLEMLPPNIQKQIKRRWFTRGTHAPNDGPKEAVTDVRHREYMMTCWRVSITSQIDTNIQNEWW